MVELLSNLDPRSVIEIAAVLLVIYVLVHRKHGTSSISPESAAWLRRMLETHHDKYVVIFFIFIFIIVTLHSVHDGKDSGISKTFENILMGATGWLGGMLTNRQTKRAADPGELQIGVAGTQETKTVTETVTKQESKPEPVLPTEPIEVKGIGNEPVKVEETKKDDD